jgi:secernin
MCDCLVALRSATGQPFSLFAKNSDRPSDEQQVIEWNPPRFESTPIRTTHIEVEPFAPGGSRRETIGCLISRPTWCWGAEHGINEAGVAIGNEAIYTTSDPRTAAPALIGMDLVRLGLECGATARHAVEVITSLLERYGQGGTGHDPHGASGAHAYWSSFLVADPAEAWVIETSGTSWAAEQVTDVRAISNRTTIASFDAEHRHPRQAVERLVDPRLAASNAVLDRRPVTYESLAAHLRSHDSCIDPGWSVCMHVDGLAAGTTGTSTTASMIGELRADGRHRAWLLVGSPCRNNYVEGDVSPLHPAAVQGSSTAASPVAMRPGSSTVA